MPLSAPTSRIYSESRYFSSTCKQLALSKIKIQANVISSNVAFSLSVAVTKIKLISITRKSNIAVYVLSQ